MEKQIQRCIKPKLRRGGSRTEYMGTSNSVRDFFEILENKKDTV